MKPSVLVLSKGLGLGGAERQIASAARFWDQDAFSYHVAFVLPHKDHFVAEIESHGVDVMCLGSGRPYLASAAMGLRRMLRATKPDLVHAHLPTTGIMARMLSAVPVVYTEHNMVHSYRRPTRLANKLTYGRNAVVVAVSDAVAGALDGYRGPQPRVINNGVTVAVSDAERAAVRVELGIDEATPLVTHVGNIRPGKGQHNLVAAAAIVHEKRPDAVFVSLGSEKVPGSLAALRRDVTDRGLDGVVRFLGSRPDAVAFTAAADVFANPSDVEGLPVAILEAMALARPVVATAVGGVPSIIRSDETGALVPPDHPEALAEAIVGLLDDPSHADRLAAGARELIERDFTMQSVVAQNEAIYRELLDG